MSEIQLPDSLNELITKLKEIGPIATLVSRTVQATLNPGEKILLTYNHLEMGGRIPGENKGPSLGSCEIKILTTSRFLELGFFPSYHQVDVKDVHKIQHFQMINRFATGYEGEGDVTSAEERGYNPVEIQLEVAFQDENGKEVLVWNQDASRADDIKKLYRYLPQLSKLVGKPLSEGV